MAWASSAIGAGKSLLSSSNSRRKKRRPSPTDPRSSGPRRPKPKLSTSQAAIKRFEEMKRRKQQKGTGRPIGGGRPATGGRIAKSKITNPKGRPAARPPRRGVRRR